MLVRFQFASLIFWQSVRSPVLFSVEQRLAIRNGSKRRKAEGKPAAVHPRRQREQGRGERNACLAGR